MGRPLLATPVLVLVLVATGCGGGGGGSHKAERKQASPARSVAAARGRVVYCVGAFFRAPEADAVRRFNARNSGRGLSARLRVLPGPEAAQARRLAALLRRPGGCDVLHASVTRVGELAEAGAAADLSDYLASRRREVIPSTLSTARYRGRDWAVPPRTDAGLIYYRPKDISHPPTSWEALYATAKRTRGLIYQGARSETLTVHFTELLFAAGGDVLAPDGRSGVLDSAAGRRALTLMRTGLRTGATPRAVTKYREEDTRVRFDRGRATFMRNWPYAFFLIHSGRTGIAREFEVAALPPFKGEKPAGTLAGFNLVSVAGSENPDGVLALIDFLPSEGPVRRAALRYSQAPALAGTYRDPFFIDAIPYAQALEQAVRQSRPRPVTPAYAAVSLAIQRHVSAALEGREATGAALRAADREIDRALSGG